jgi:NAD(P)H-dependent FMN reductase
MAKPVGDWALAVASARKDITVELIDLKEWNLPIFALPKGPSGGNYQDPLQRRWAEKIAQGEGYLFISPEYNHGYSAVLKNALDYLYAEWARKPAGCIAYGSVKGARSVEQLRLVLVELQMAPLRDAVHIADIWGKVQDGRFHADDSDAKQLQRVLDELCWWGNALRSAKGNVVQ